MKYFIKTANFENLTSISMTQQTDRYFNGTIDKKENIGEDKECYNKLQIKTSAKKIVLKRKDCFIRRTGKE